MEYMQCFRIQPELEQSKFTISVKFSYPLVAPWATVPIQWWRIIPLDWADNHERPLTPLICLPYFKSLSPLLKRTYADWPPGHIKGGRSYSCMGTNSFSSGLHVEISVRVVAKKRSYWRQYQTCNLSPSALLTWVNNNFSAADDSPLQLVTPNENVGLVYCRDLPTERTAAIVV